ncbi:N-terminal nucleophile aminohydrolase [Saitoella complicata NRRL Y-17804]|uniref:N-terminal nucleophile aminohydrolase n=1 Tax=Saitoella complicata (strain BCRC 22490 / CBS 7301 / JCM 7358 / NBRC 10748 / NRRL Y-17804) TaxID=698492 RepID=UPI0008676EEE|nr:N-terminal nucleophile aminohydrolase [Saitoella complicata NRRL Y-17804]ODQ55318.1 N-terminal nucleophile aminohydrolase [Saitoella complicata NRRL Y-17804]
MSSIGTGYDLSNSTFSPDGRVFQVEYASKAIENAPTAIGLRTSTYTLLALAKLRPSALLTPNTDRRISHVDRHAGVAFSGLVPDGMHFVKRAREEAGGWRKNYKERISGKVLAERMGGYLQAYTMYSSVRPFGIAGIIGAVDEDGPQLYMVEPSGLYWGYHATAAGKGRQLARTELEKLDLSSLSPADAVKHAARIILLTHDDAKEKDIELEMSWVAVKGAGEGEVGPREAGIHEFVPRELIEEAVRAAREE